MSLCATVALAFALAGSQDVAAPRKLAGPPAAYPLMARQALVQGLVLLAVTVDETGQPIDIKILRGIPLLNEAAVEAVKSWRYEPTVVDGTPRRLQFVERIGFFLSDKDKVRAYTGMARDRREQVALRVWAISQLVPAPPKQRKQVAQVLSALASDPDATVAKAATIALEQLGPEGK